MLSPTTFLSGQYTGNMHFPAKGRRWIVHRQNSMLSFFCQSGHYSPPGMSSRYINSGVHPHAAAQFPHTSCQARLGVYQPTFSGCRPPAEAWSQPAHFISCLSSLPSLSYALQHCPDKDRGAKDQWLALLLWRLSSGAMHWHVSTESLPLAYAWHLFPPPL